MSRLIISKWGKVTSDPQGTGVSFVRVQKTRAGGFLVLTLEGGTQYDMWVETQDEVVEYLSVFQLDWAPSSGPGAAYDT